MVDVRQLLKARSHNIKVQGKGKRIPRGVYQRKISFEQGIIAEPTKKCSEEGLTLEEHLLSKYYLKHLDVDKIDFSKNTAVLLMSDVYAQEYGDKQLYDFLEQHISPSYWAAYVAQSCSKKLNNFIRRVQRGGRQPMKSIEQEMAENVIHKYVQLSFDKYLEKISAEEHHMVVLCDYLLRIHPAYSDVNGLCDSVKERITMVDEVFNAHNIDIKKDGLNALHKINGIVELQIKE